MLAIAAVAASSPAAAQIEELLRRLPGLPGAPAGEPGETRIAAGLKQALEIGASNAVALTGRVDGYLATQAIRIVMPERLRTVERALRTVGFDRELDAFVVSMNRAAERAAPSARPIFLSAISGMTFADVRQILKGSDTAATDYFKQKTSTPLADAFQPIVSEAMEQVGVTRQYKELIGRAQAVPFLRLDDFDLDRYVVGKALDGLFFVVADEERKIRTDPAARVTDLLREVFGTRR